MKTIKQVQFVMLPTKVLSSVAFRALKIHELRTLNRLMLEDGRHAGRDNGKLPVTYRDLVSYGVDPHHIAASLRVLEGLGLVVCMERGRGANAEYRHPSLYRLTFLRTLVPGGNGQSQWIAPTDDWAKIETAEQAKALAAPHRPRDLRDRRSPKPKPPRNPEDQHDGQHGRTGTPV
jgi:hypothetical protein